MKNFVQNGDVVTVIANANFKSGELRKVGNVIGVCAFDAESGKECELAIGQVYEFPKPSGDAFAFGDHVYLDETIHGVNATATNPKVGVALNDAGAGTDTVIVRLNRDL